MKHLGDITKIDGAAVEPVEVIIGGSPCQDLSVAGKREGLSGERSGLFMEQIRIIKEMREKSAESGADVIIPRFFVWENVVGALSSPSKNKGEDFRIVLEETARVVEPTAVIPRPEKGKWTNAGAIVGDGWSIAWRVFNSEHWGVPQRRRRIALIGDFGGATAPEILFERKGVSGNTQASGTPWKDFAAAIAERFGGANQAKRGVEHLTYCIQGNSIDRSDTAGCNGKGVKEGVSYTLNTIDRPAVYDYDRRHDKCQGVEVAPTVTAKYGTGGGNTPHRVTDYTALCVRERCGCDGGGKGLLIQKDKSGTLAANNDQFTVCIGNGQSNSMKPTEKAGAVNCMHDQQAIITLDRAAFNQGENALYEPKISEDGINSTLTAKGPSDVCAAVDCRNGTENEEINGTLQAKSNGGTSYNLQNVVRISNAVRRLTPLECERLQGFPDGWTDIGEYTDTKGKKRKTSDSARYKSLGNSIALPSWAWLLERLNRYCRYHTMASLFDGIGGFPLIWQELGGQCLWASEIEEFCIAVTKYHFGED